jgi:cell division protein ZapE
VPTPRLVDREPVVPAETLVASMVPPPRFDAVRFATYRPDPDQPSQAAAVQALQEFATRLQPAPKRLFGRSRPPQGRPGVYLDGGFGVGKTHLLASLWHEAPSRRAYGTFVELTHLVGALGFAQTVDALSGHRLLAIDEFELDDPATPVLVSSLLSKLVDAGRPGRGDVEHAARLARRRAVRRAGLPARDPGPVGPLRAAARGRRGLPAPRPAGAPAPVSDEEVAQRSRRSRGRRSTGSRRCCSTWAGCTRAVTARSCRTCPWSRCSAWCPVIDQAAALRLVVLADRLYDRDVPVVTSGVPMDRCSRTSCCRAATARSTCGRSRG